VIQYILGKSSNWPRWE